MIRATIILTGGTYYLPGGGTNPSVIYDYYIPAEYSGFTAKIYAWGPGGNGGDATSTNPNLAGGGGGAAGQLTIITTNNLTRIQVRQIGVPCETNLNTTSTHAYLYYNGSAGVSAQLLAAGGKKGSNGNNSIGLGAIGWIDYTGTSGFTAANGGDAWQSAAGIQGGGGGGAGGSLRTTGDTGHNADDPGYTAGIYNGGLGGVGHNGIASTYTNSGVTIGLNGGDGGEYADSGNPHITYRPKQSAWTVYPGYPGMTPGGGGGGAITNSFFYSGGYSADGGVGGNGRIAITFNKTNKNSSSIIF